MAGHDFKPLRRRIHLQPRRTGRFSRASCTSSLASRKFPRVSGGVSLDTSLLDAFETHLCLMCLRCQWLCTCRVWSPLFVSWARDVPAGVPVPPGGAFYVIPCECGRHAVPFLPRVARATRYNAPPRGPADFTYRQGPGCVRPANPLQSLRSACATITNAQPASEATSSGPFLPEGVAGGPY